jgi:pimeloyl-ACP methyl ester carboxylesterase
VTALQRDDSTLRLTDGRVLAYIDWLRANTTPVVLFHGAPGSRLFHPDPRATASRGVRLVTFDRPGYGGSARHAGRSLVDTPADVGALVDYLGIDRFAVLGVSAGGGHALACAADGALAPRITAVGVASVPGPLDEVPGAWEALPDHVRPAAETARRDPDRAVRGIVRYMQPWVDGPDSFLKGGPEADRVLLADPVHRRMLLADVAEAFRLGAAGFADDMVALWRPWGFVLSDLPAGTRIWHGAQDTRAEADFRHLMGTLPAAQPDIWRDQGHYGVVAHWARVLEALVDGVRAKTY